MVSDKLVQRIYENKIRPELQPRKRKQTLNEFIERYPRITHRAIKLNVESSLTSEGSLSRSFAIPDSLELVERFLEVHLKGENSLPSRVKNLYKKGMGEEAYQLTEKYRSKLKPLVEEVSDLKAQIHYFNRSKKLRVW